MANSSKRFATVTENDLRKLLDEKEAVNTKRATKTAVKVFTEYIIEKKISEPQDKESIAKVLKLFYAEVRKILMSKILMLLLNYKIVLTSGPSPENFSGGCKVILTD